MNDIIKYGIIALLVYYAIRYLMEIVKRLYVGYALGGYRGVIFALISILMSLGVVVIIFLVLSKCAII